MSRLLALCALCLLLIGCDNHRAAEWTEAFKEMRDDCTGTLTFTLSKSSWDEQVSMSCAEDLSDE